MDARESRLEQEFERMRNLAGLHSLFEFRCADLSDREAAEFLKVSMNRNIIETAMKGCMTPDEFVRRNPGVAPDKYLVRYSCKGLMKTDKDEVVESDHHMMGVVYGYDYPSNPPILIWFTPIWHPNISMPYICTQGRPFAVSVTLDHIVLTVGEMIQYRNYNLRNPLDYEATEWARENIERFPIDDRDLVDSRRRIASRLATGDAGSDALVELLDFNSDSDESKKIVELID